MIKDLRFTVINELNKNFESYLLSTWSTNAVGFICTVGISADV